VHVDDAAERSQRQIGRPSTVANFRKQVVEILQETPDLAALEILRRVREAGYQGGKTVLYALGASLRPKPAKPLVRFEGLPGEFSQHDFGQVEVEFLNGARIGSHVALLSALWEESPVSRCLFRFGLCFTLEDGRTRAVSAEAPEAPKRQNVSSILFSSRSPQRCHLWNSNPTVIKPASAIDSFSQTEPGSALKTPKHNLAQ